MKSFKLTRLMFAATMVLALPLSLMSPRTAIGAIEAYSFLDIAGFGLYRDLGGGVKGAPITVGVDVALLAPPFFTSSATADVASIPGIAATAAGSPIPTIGLDTAQAYQGAVPPPPNTFINLPGDFPHGHSDTIGGGSIIGGTPFPFGGAGTVAAEGQLKTTFFSTDFATADSAVSSTGSITIIPLVPLSIVGEFTATKEMVADLTPAPPGISSTADTSFTVEITDPSGIIFEWSPDGTGSVVGGTSFLDPFNLQTSISAVPGGTSTFASIVGVFKAGVSLLPGIAYSFTVEQSAAASVANFNIPEPASVAVWIGLIAGVLMRRKRQNIS